MSQSYNVFISWSGERSRVLAQKLREWIPRVVQAARPWMSEADIEKGSRGLNELTKALYTMKVAVACLTPDNLEAPWLLFEAGALSKTIDDSNRLCTYLLDGLQPQDIKPPLGMFQATRATKEDSKKLIQTINLSVSDEPLRQEDLDEIFEAMWPSLEATINSLPLLPSAKTIKRSSDDILAEILEIVRAFASRKRSETIVERLSNEGPAQIEAIKAAAGRHAQFLYELVESARRWELDDGEVRIYFGKEQRALADLLQSRDRLDKLRTIAGEVLGMPVTIKVKLDGAA